MERRQWKGEEGEYLDRSGPNCKRGEAKGQRIHKAGEGKLRGRRVESKKVVQFPRLPPSCTPVASFEVVLFGH